MNNPSSRVTLVVGLLLIMLGALFLAGQIFDFDFWDWLWPFILIGAGALFFVGMFAAGRGAAGLAIPGSIIITVGLILLFGTLTDHWEVWAYAWGLIVASVGVGIAVQGWYSGQPGVRRGGLALMRTGLFLFFAFGAFFELLIFRTSPYAGYAGPALLIILGLYLLVTRAFNLGGRERLPETPAASAVIENQSQPGEPGDGPRA